MSVPKLVTMKKTTLWASLLGIVSLVLGVIASATGLIVHFHPIISVAVGMLLAALGGAAEGYAYGVGTTPWSSRKGEALHPAPEVQRTSLLTQS
jgi:hypothetical protein